MISEQRRKRVEELLQISQGGDASAKQIDELNDLLRNDEELRYVAVRSLQFDAMLQEEFQVRNTAILFDPSSSSGSNPALDPSAVKTGRNSVAEPSENNENNTFLGPWVLMLAATIIGVSVVYSTLLYNANQASVQLANHSSKPILSRPDQSSFLDFDNVMTVTYQEDALWDMDVQIGDQFDFGHIHLRKGVARLNSIYGAVVILDAREGPVRATLDADRSMTVLEGRVLAKAYDQALGFTLRTPTTNVVDIGTEFAVSVDSDGNSDVTVLQGAVTWLPRDRASNSGRSMLAEGNAVRFRSSSDNQGITLKGDADHLDELRAFATRINSRDDCPPPQVHESFDYPLGVMRKDPGGIGWSEPWFKHSAPVIAPSGVIRQGGYLIDPAWLQPSSPRYTVISLSSASERLIAEPISVDVEQDVYMSFLTRKRVIELPRDDRCGAGIALFSATGEQQFGVSIDMRENLTIFNGSKHFGGRHLEPDQTYLIVLKLELHREQPDQIFAKAYSEVDPPAACEPVLWDTSAPGADQRGTIDHVRLWSDATAIAAFDEIRIGSTWNAVVPIRH
ncbi:MAG: FecR domain-containing protein [Rhodopirellula sp. JB044]|uniref:FecR domain-containing protein n=1 Tax=Rhodopirellula sp. JB044 TaxID=3342844 RepID=UPI00370A5D68